MPQIDWFQNKNPAIFFNEQMPQRIKVVLNNLDSFFITQPEVLIPIAFKYV